MGVPPTLVDPGIPGYRILATLGEGGMGAVFLAEQTALRRQVALKLLKPDSSGGDSPERMLREARLMARVRHPYLIGILDMGVTPSGLPWLAMERIEGDTLARELSRRGRLPSDLVTTSMTQVAEALDALHGAGVVHRDLKPGNLMRTKDGTVRLMDLGLARGSGDAPLTGTGLIMGTPEYVSPEVLLGASFQPSDDWYAWGITTWELLAGHPPLGPEQALARIRASRPPEPPAPLPPPPDPEGRLPPGWHALLLACLGPRKDRPVTREDRERLMAGAPHPALEPTVATPRPRRPGPEPSPTLLADLRDRPSRVRHRAPAATAVVLGLCALVGLGSLLARARYPAAPEPLPTPLSPLAGPDPERRRIDIALLSTYRDPANVLWHLRAPGAPRLSAFHADRSGPVPVFHEGHDEAWVWVTGLAPDESGEVTVEVPGTPWSRVLRFGQVAPEPDGESLDRPPGRIPPAVSDHLWSTATRESRALAQRWLDRAVAPEAELPSSANPLEVRLSMASLSHIPALAWAPLLHRMQRSDRHTEHLVRMLAELEVHPPPAIAWQIVHLLPRLAAARWMNGAWSIYQRLAATALRAAHPPAAFLGELLTWHAALPRSRRALYHLLVARAATRTPEELPYRLLGWDPTPDSPDPRVLALEDLLARAGAGATGDLVERSAPRPGREPDAVSLFALALVGSDPGDAHIPWLFERYATGTPEVAEAADAALEARQQPIGMVSDCAADPHLWFWGVDHPVLEDLARDPPGPLAFRPEVERVWGWITARTTRISWRVPGRAPTRIRVDCP